MPSVVYVLTRYPQMQRNRGRHMWRLLIVGIVLLLAACSPTTDPTTTTVNTADTSTSSTAATTTTRADATTSTVTTSTTTAVPTTTTTQPEPTTTTKPQPTTTITVPEGNEPPTLDIISPTSLAAYTASYDADRDDFGANVSLSAVVSDPDGDDVTVTWSSSTQGGLGTGESIVVFLSTGGYDASQPIISATATDVWGAATSTSVQIIVWIPSDT